MTKLIIDATNENFFLMLIDNKNIYNTSHTNSKFNYEKLMVLIDEFLTLQKKKLEDISKIYINRGPGSFAGIRNSIAIVKAIFLAKKIDYYCFSFKDFVNHSDIKYENIPELCVKYKIKKNLIKPIYLS
jgi:tRNA threonylcarbamoyladenosine biosynthesis protein TsaB